MKGTDRQAVLKLSCSTRQVLGETKMWFQFFTNIVHP